MKKIHCILIRTILIILVPTLSGCNGKSSKGKESDQPIITVTLEPQRFITEAIAGDKFKVVSMVPKGSSAETYDPIPEQLVSLGESKAYFRIGYIGFEQNWMERLLDNTPHLQVIDTSKGIDLILNGNQAACQEEGSHEGHAHVHPVEPHVWNSAKNALILASNTYNALCRLDKKNEAYYLIRYDSLCNRINQTDSLIRKILQSPNTSRSFAIYHPALSYYARDYGLNQISIEEGGKEPSPSHLKELVDRCRKEKVKVIFIQPEFDKRNAEIIAKETNTKIVPINPLSYDWETEMINVANALANPN